MFSFPVNVHTDENPGVALTCDAIPEFNAYGDDLEAALAEGVDAMESAFSLYVDDRRAIPPAPKPERGQVLLHLPTVTVAKVLLWNAMVERDLRKADLRRLLDVNPVQVDRLIDFLHTSKIEQLEAALSALELRLAVSLETAA